MAWVHTPGGWHSELTMICFHIQFDSRQQRLNIVIFSGHGVLFFSESTEMDITDPVFVGFIVSKGRTI